MAPESGEVVEALCARGIPAEIAKECVQALMAEAERSEGIRPPNEGSGEGLTVPLFRYVVRDDDIGMLAAIIEAILAALGMGLLGGASGAPPKLAGVPAGYVTGAFMVGLRVLRNLWKKGAILDPIHFKLVTVLKNQQRPLSVEELVLVLEQDPAFRHDGLKFSAAEVTAELTKLSALRLRDGTIVPIIASDGDGLWSTCGI